MGSTPKTPLDIRLMRRIFGVAKEATVAQDNTKEIRIKVTEGQLEQIRAEAERLGLTVAGYVRLLALQNVMQRNL